MKIDNKLIKELREKTGAGIVDVKKALEETKGDAKKAIEALRKKGEEIAAKKQTREISQGMIACYVHNDNKSASLVELNCETDFVAKNKEFKELGKNLAMQVVAMDPQYLSPENVPDEVLDKEKEIIKEQLEKENKPAEIIDKIVKGKINKFYEEVCLLKQSYIKEDKKKIEDLITEKIAKLGENIKVSRFVKYSL
ncbi:MAG: translation elongation factor Ts [Patescibacteria group bacterium]|nr:translation elongation factor Ts [Patescibacteria group bacterium]